MVVSVDLGKLGIKMNVLLVYPNLMFNMQIPNHLPILSACLKKEGHNVRLFDTTLYRTSEKSVDDCRTERLHMAKIDLGVTAKENLFEDFQIAVDEFKPQLIGVSAVDNTIDLGLKIIGSLRTHVLTIFGGKHATFNPEIIDQPEVDIVCIGDGEKAIVELCRRLESWKQIGDIDNLWVKTTNGIMKNKIGEPSDLNCLPFDDFELFGHERMLAPIKDKMRKMISVSIDRGCPYTCTFCGAPGIKKIYSAAGRTYYRSKSIKRISDELAFQIEKYKPEYINLNSETLLNMPTKKLIDFANVYSKYKIPFWCQTRPETITDEKIKILRDMNCNSVGIGLDHGNEDFRARILDKHYTNDQLREAFDILNKYGMRINVNCIIGFPDETRELVFDTIRLSRELRYYSIMAFTFQPYYGTKLRDYCLEKGYIKNVNLGGVENCLAGATTLDMPQFRPEAIEGMLRTFALYARMSVAYYVDIKTAEKQDDVGNEMLEKLKKIYFEAKK